MPDAGLVAADAGANVVGLPAFASAGISGSQIIALVITQASAWPSAMMCSASCGWLIRPATSTGTRTAARSFPACGAR